MTTLYNAIGQLFYAVAACDKTIREEEKNALRVALRKTWLPADSTSIQIAQKFKELLEEAPDAWDSFRFFKSFKLENEGLFHQELKRMILQTSSAITNAVAGKNKSELVMLAQLDALLRNI